MKTAMQQLLAQLKDERANLPMTIEWDRCYQAIEMVIQHTYLSIEKEQILDACKHGFQVDAEDDNWLGDDEQAKMYYNKTFKKD
jgi:hypothetical protein